MKITRFECESCGKISNLEKNKSRKRFIYCTHCDGCRTFIMIDDTEEVKEVK